jgi:SAM-dependent methyltransferase
MTTVSAVPKVPRADGTAQSSLAAKAGRSNTAPGSLDGSAPRPAQDIPEEFSGPLLTADRETIEALRRVFEACRLSQAALREALGPNASERLSRAEAPVYQRRLAAPTPLHTLLKLFTLQLGVDEPAAREAFAPVPLERLSALGLLEYGAKGVHARVGLSFCEDLWLFHDRMVADPNLLCPDHVLGANPAAFTLANLTVRTPVRLALDVGTGCGVQALLAAKHCQNVIATDTNPRALNYALFNARLNRRSNVECRLGSFFEPVAGCKFDLIVSNLPFVISPESEYLFRDSGLPADQLSEQAIRATPAFLNEGGFASILCSWAHWKKEEDWSARPREWAAGSGCDAYALRGQTQDPLGHAAIWNEGYEPAALGKRLDRWQEYYERLGIKALTVGAVILRRRSASRNWSVMDELPQKFAGSCSDHIVRIMHAQDFLAGLSNDDDLFDRVFTMPPDHFLRQTLVHQPGRFVVQKMRLELKGGLRLRGNLDPASFQLLQRCDGQRPLRDILAELAETGKTSLAQIREQASRVSRELIRCGFLVPSPGTKAGEAGPLRGEAGFAAKSQGAPGPAPGVTMEVNHE